MSFSNKSAEKDINILIIDMQPIDPPIGGGRLRLFGLYHDLGCLTNSTYIGTYDWPGENYRDHYLSDTLREINIPLSKEHFAANDQLKRDSGGVNFIDVLFSRFGHLSQQYILKLKEYIPNADIIIFSHPWVFPLVRDCLDFNRQYIIYDSQNVESYLKYTLLEDGGGLGTTAVREVIKSEHDLCKLAHNIFVCSSEDGEMFNRLFGIPLSKMVIVPNGVFIDKIKPVANECSYNNIKKSLGFKKPIIFFMGSHYAPNIDAAHFIMDELAPAISTADFVIAGGVGQDPDIVSKSIKLDNVIITGIIDENDKLGYLHASDIAINPIFSGSGTNIKMFDFMAAGIPVVSTGIGARGIVDKSSNGITLSTKINFPSTLIALINQDRKHRLNIGQKGRKYVEEKNSWNKISKGLGSYLITQLENVKDRKFFHLNNKPARTKVGILTTWNIPCGIASYSKYLSEGFNQNNYDVIIFGNDHIKELNKVDISTYKNFYPAWDYHFNRPDDSRFYIDTIIELIAKYEVDYFFIQHHDAFFPVNSILDLCVEIEKLPLKTAITFHNNSELGSDILNKFKSCGVNLFTHVKSEHASFSRKSHVKYIPHGVLDFNGIEGGTLNMSKEKRLASFGFLRPHKGVLELIQSMPLILNNYPDTKLTCINSLYPSEDSQRYYIQCKNEIKRLALNDYIQLCTEYLPIDSIIKILSTSNLIVFPYYPVDDFASGAVNIAIACKKPVLISKSDIFNNFSGIFPKIEEITPESIAKSVCNFFEKGSLEKFKKIAVDYAEKNSWNNIAQMYIEQST